VYTIRKEVTHELKIDKVIDPKIRSILEKRLENFKGDAKLAFANLTENPIWLNEEKRIEIKRVTISGISNAVSLRDKKDHNGNLILDDAGKKIAVDFVNTGSNHHVAIYKDENGNLQEKVVSFYEAVERVNQDLPIIDKSHNHENGWQFQFTMKQNECFVFPNGRTGFNPNEIDLQDAEKYHLISPNLYRVQKIATKNYFFRHHLETTVEAKKELVNISYKPQLGLNGIVGIVKVRINHLGKIVEIGEK
jgi:CRISPR-associated endonuclease Csn1